MDLVLVYYNNPVMHPFSHYSINNSFCNFYLNLIYFYVFEVF